MTTHLTRSLNWFYSLWSVFSFKQDASYSELKRNTTEETKISLLREPLSQQQTRENKENSVPEVNFIHPRYLVRLPEFCRVPAARWRTHIVWENSGWRGSSLGARRSPWTHHTATGCEKEPQQILRGISIPPHQSKKRSPIILHKKWFYSERLED